MNTDLEGMVAALTAPDGPPFDREFAVAIQQFADCILDAEPADRLAALSTLARMAQRMRYCQVHIDSDLSARAEEAGYVRQKSATVEYYQTNAEVQGRLLAGVGYSLLPEMECGHWFAVRIDASTAVPLYRTASTAEVRVRTTVVPLDGGTLHGVYT